MNENTNAKTILTIVLTAPTGDQYREEVKQGKTLDGGFCYFRQHHTQGFKWEIQTDYEKEATDDRIFWHLENLCADDAPADVEEFFALGLLD